MLGEIVGVIVPARFPVNVELTLADVIADPIKTHVDGLGSFFFFFFIGNADSSAVVCLDGHQRLACRVNGSPPHVRPDSRSRLASWL